MWAFWTQRLRRTSEEFWALSYREIHACIEEYLDEREERLMLFGTGAAVQLTVAAHGKQQFTWMDIFEPRKPKAPVDKIAERREQWRRTHMIAGTN